MQGTSVVVPAMPTALTAQPAGGLVLDHVAIAWEGAPDLGAESISWPGLVLSFGIRDDLCLSDFFCLNWMLGRMSRVRQLAAEVKRMH